MPSATRRTGLASCADFQTSLAAACAAANDRPSTVKIYCTALLMIDPDSRISINDLFGQDVGDRALCEVANRLLLVARTDDLVCRLGGNVFAILCQKLKSEEIAINIAARVHSALADTFHIDRKTVSLRADPRSFDSR